MNHRHLAVLVAVAGLGLGWPLVASAQEQGNSADMAAMMEAYEKAATPGAEHAALGRMVGEWDIEVRMYMDPSGEPMVSRGTSKTEWIMDGRFVRETVTGDFMGDPFHGMGLTGYNNVTGDYESAWIDDHTTQLYRYRGWKDDEGRMVFVSESEDPVSGEMVKGRTVSEFLSDDEMVTRSYEDRGDGEVLTMELRYTREM